MQDRIYFWIEVIIFMQPLSMIFKLELLLIYSKLTKIFLISLFL